MHGIYSHIMIDLILVNEDTCVFGNVISVQGDVSRGAEEDKPTESFNNTTNTVA